jgi:putative drug exporter of the RND superfamily
MKELVAVPKKAFTVRVASWSAHHPWRAILAWLGTVIFCVLLGSMVIGTRDANSADYRVGEAGRAETIESEAGLTRPVLEYILISAAPGQSFDAAAASSAADDVTKRMSVLPQVAGVGKPITATDGSAVEVPVTMRADDRSAHSDIQPLLDTTAAVQAAHPQLRIEETGNTSIDAGIDIQLGKDLQLAERITLPITLLILLIVFGALVAAGIPLVLALVSVVTAMSLSAVASHLFPDAGATKNVVLLMGMAVGVDYSLFYLKREREERRRAGGKISPQAAVELAAATSGHTVLVSGLAVTASMLGLYLADDVIFSSLATGSVIVVLVAMISALTVLPALLVKLHRWLDRPRLPLLGRRADREGGGRVWSALLRPAVRHPVATLVLSTLAMLALATPALSMKIALPGNGSLPREVPALQTFDRMTAKFPAEGVTHSVVVRADPGQSAQVAAALTGLAQQAAANPLFVHGNPAPVEVSADHAVSRIELPIPYSSDAPQAAQSLRLLRTQLLPAAMAALPGAEYAVTGYAARDIDTVAHQNDRLGWVVGFVIILTFAVMLWAFRSLVMATMAVLLNLLSAAAAFGVLVAVFQSDWAGKLLDFQSSGFIVSRVPLFLFVILFGLSMDYHVFVVSSIRERALRGEDARRAVFNGIISSAGVVTGAAVVMVSVFISFAFTSLLEMKELGLGLAVAVLLDAFVIRVLILPSLMTLLGGYSWWPSKIPAAPATPPAVMLPKTPAPVGSTGPE